MLKAKLDSKKDAWVEEILVVLWAYRTTTCTLTGETSFSLTYGAEAVILIEMAIHTYRVSGHDSEQNNLDLRANVDLLKVKREKRRSKHEKLLLSTTCKTVLKCLGQNQEICRGQPGPPRNNAPYSGLGEGKT